MNSFQIPDNKRCLVIGGGGFVGRALCLSLLELGCEVFSISRGNYPELTDKGVKCLQADIANPREDFFDFFQNIDVVFHTAAKVEMCGDYSEFYKINVVGTENAIKACKDNKVPILVYTSSPSVIASGIDLINVNEDIDYPKKYLAYYPETKAKAERLVLENNSNELRTCSLRPHLIYGPGDTNLIPTILKKAKAGRLVQVGNGSNKVDRTHIANCVNAHILAWIAMSKDSSASGKSYFISDGKPVNLWQWINQILKENNLAPVTKKIPATLAYYLAYIFELIAKLVPLKLDPPFTRFLVEEMCTDHYFDLGNAKKFLGYYPSIYN
jgi:nucleoside-diphosphate-sugar epimerase